jgi:hypothetical protein
MRLRQIISLAAIALFIALLGGCATSTPHPHKTQSPPGPSASASIIVTQGFAKPAILEETVAIDGTTTALDALQIVASVETGHGGGFVSSIEGISPKYEGNEEATKAWFFYINGIASSTGAGDYILQDGDCEHWDYHDWSFRQFVTAIIGSFPEPFVHGSGGEVYPTVVTYQDGWQESAREIADSLGGLGVQDITCRGFDELSEATKETSNLVLVGTSDFEPVRELNEPWDLLGFYGHFQDGTLVVFDSVGELAGEYGEGSGIIQATQSIWNPDGIGAGENVVWMVSGLGESGVKAAVDTLVSHPDALGYACAVVVTQGEILRLPR